MLLDNGDLSVQRLLFETTVLASDDEDGACGVRLCVGMLVNIILHGLGDDVADERSTSRLYE